MKPALLALGLLCLPLASRAQDPEPPVIDRDSVWFQPSLTVNAAPVCADLLRVEQENFFSPTATPNHERDGFKKLRERHLEPIVADPHVLPMGESYDQQLRLTLPNQQSAFVYFLKYPGCGGGCESEQVLVSDKPFEPAPSYRHSFPETRNAPAWPMYKGSDGEFYVVGHLEHRLAVYKITPAAPVLACEVKLRPSSLSEHEDASVRSAAHAVGELMRAAGQMYQDAGECGSGKFHMLRWEAGSDALYRTLYQPWVMTELLGPLPSVDVYRGRDYDSIAKNLAKWSLGGVEDHRKYSDYRQQLELTTAELGRFYHETYGWPTAQAQEIAVSVLRNAMGRIFAFNGYGSASAETQLRQAILERQPLSIIKKLSLQGVAKQRPEEVPSEQESVLNVAIEYPEALQYLLEQGFDPNSANAFGKTPLMYAAQHDQLEAARLLLAAGADPNAATYLPEDTCYYQIFRSGMTPLHYAARYASAPLIRLLVARGAATFSKANLDQFSELQHYPLQWLEAYAGSDPRPKRFPTVEQDRNPRISAEELPDLFELLRVPSDEERQRMSVSALSLAQEAYTRGGFKVAYRHVQFAVAAQPDNEKALADLALMAMKAGAPHRALAAAKQLIESSPSGALQASAWFNLGLLCEQDSIRKTLFYRGASCDPDWLQPFAQAWKLQPTAARAKKLQQLFDKRGTGTCSSPDSRADQKVWLVTTGYGAHQVDRIYIRHRDTGSLDVAANDLKVTDRLKLGDYAVTVLEGRPTRAIPNIDGQTCRMPSAQR